MAQYQTYNKKDSQMRVSKKPDICFICNEPFSNKELKIRISSTNCRHVKCTPGSPKWMKSKIGKDSKMRQYFK